MNNLTFISTDSVDHFKNANSYGSLAVGVNPKTKTPTMLVADGIAIGGVSKSIVNGAGKITVPKSELRVSKVQGDNGTFTLLHKAGAQLEIADTL